MPQGKRPWWRTGYGRLAAVMGFIGLVFALALLPLAERLLRGDAHDAALADDEGPPRRGLARPAPRALSGRDPRHPGGDPAALGARRRRPPVPPDRRRGRHGGVAGNDDQHER